MRLRFQIRSHQQLLEYAPGELENLPGWKPLNAYADESEADTLGNATDIIDAQTTITP